MWFLNPSGLWWLAACALVLLLYWLRPRRVPVVVPSVLLWRRTLQDPSLQRPARRFERSVLLLLQLLAVAAASVALARPQRLTAGSGDVVVVLDLGVRMQATDVRPSRFEAARLAASKFLAQVPASRVAVVAAARTPRLVHPLTPHREDALRALRELEPTDGPSDLEVAVRVARSLNPQARVHTFSDRASEQATPHMFGGPLEDVSITGLVASPLPGDRMRVAVTVRNSTAATRRVEVSVVVDGRPQGKLSLPVAPHAEATGKVAVPAGVWVEATLSGQDELPATDRYAALGTWRPPLRVLRVGAEDPYLERGLEVVAGTVDRARKVDPRSWAAFPVVVLHRAPPVDLPPGAYLLVNSPPANLPVRAAGTLPEDVVLHQSRTHVLLRFVNLLGVRVKRAWRMEARAGEVLAQGAAPLLWAYESDEVRVVVLPFSPSQSDLPLRPDFPIFLANALDWLAGPWASQVEAGRSVSVPSGALQEAVLHGPAGSVRVRSRAGRFMLPPFDRAGVYVLEAKGLQRVWAVHPSSAPVRGGLLTGAGAARKPASEQAPWLVGLFVGLLALEWWVFSSGAGRS
ncbi:MAG: hypothetical protein C4304_04820 [candidate division GAL15 bacterium]